MIWHDTGPRDAGPFQATDLKICDLCGALNLAENAECFVCRWRGHFERRPEVVKLAMEVVERRQGRIDVTTCSDGEAVHEAGIGFGEWLSVLLVRARWMFFHR